jgi:hypothetical protein
MLVRCAMGVEASAHRRAYRSAHKRKSVSTHVIMMGRRRMEVFGAQTCWSNHTMRKAPARLLRGVSIHVDGGVLT